MLTAQRHAVLSGRVSSRCGPMLPARPAARSLIIRRFRDEKQPGDLTDELQQQITSAASGKRPSETKLSPEQLEELRLKEAGNFTNRTAEMRADLGSAAHDLSEYQTFDGPIPETVNGRLAMLGVLTGLYAEFVTGTGLREQTAHHPWRVLFVGLLIAFASYAPVIKGYTRKEPFANKFLGISWSPMAENWNGRLAMLGFTGMILTEAITGVNTLQAWGLQAVHYMPPAGLPPAL